MPFIKGKSTPGAGRPVGSGLKPRLADYLTKEDVDKLVAKALKLASEGDKDMLKFVLDHNFGRAPQAMDVTTNGKDFPTPIYNGNATGGK